MSNYPKKELKDAFNVFDSDHLGSIDHNELAQIMKKLGQALTDAQIDSLARGKQPLSNLRAF